MIERKGDEKDAKKSVKIVDIKEEVAVDNDDDQFEKEDQILANRRKLAEKLSKKKVDTKKVDTKYVDTTVRRCLI